MAHANEIIKKLNLSPHPEGGYFRETFRDASKQGQRAWSTAILYLLKVGEVSHWHRVDAAEIWHWHAGAPLELKQANYGEIKTQKLGNDILAGQSPQIIVPAHAWQSARSLGDWTLVGCTVAPAFEFEHFELAPAGWTP